MYGIFGKPLVRASPLIPKPPSMSVSVDWVARHTAKAKEGENGRSLCKQPRPQSKSTQHGQMILTITQSMVLEQPH